MPGIEIRRPTSEDVEELAEFFRTVITGAFAKEGLSELLDDIEEEIASKVRYLHQDLQTAGRQRFFWIALAGERIIGTIEYGPANTLIRDATEGRLSDVPEIGTVFVHPDNQGEGIGTLLLKVMCLSLLAAGHDAFCLDSGYAKAQGFWRKMLGEPDDVLRDHWGEGAHHMIWMRAVHDVPIVFETKQSSVSDSAGLHTAKSVCS